MLLQQKSISFLCWYRLIPLLQYYDLPPPKGDGPPRMLFNIEDNIPGGLTLSHTLQRSTEKINTIAWSPNNNILATPSDENTIRLWDAKRGTFLRTLKGHLKAVLSVTWSPDGHNIASCSADQTIRIWETDTGQSIQTLKGHSNRIRSITWSPDGQYLASGGDDEAINIWDVKTWKCLETFKHNSNQINSLVWSPDGEILASAGDRCVLWDKKAGYTPRQLIKVRNSLIKLRSITWSSNGQLLAIASDDNTIFICDAKTSQQIYRLEGHVNSVSSVSFSCDNRLLASKSLDGTIRLWRTDSWETVALLKEETNENPYSIRPYYNNTPSLSFHPHKLVLATLGEKGSAIRIWNLEVDEILGTTPVPSPILPLPIHYTNARIVLIGDSGVGKSGLALVLTGQPFSPTTSTHGCYIWTFSSQETISEEGVKETRETLLWDLAGQPGYRIIHQLYLNEVAVALIVFDARNEMDPFAGVKYWNRALRTAKSLDSMANGPTKKFLVAARVDRGGIGVSRERLENLINELGFDKYFETSALEMQGIPRLIDEIKSAINWAIIPKVSSTVLFQQIKEFLVGQKKTGQALSTADELYRDFLRSEESPLETEELRAQFETCIGLVESRGLIQRLKFGNLILLQPELLDIYASALINTVRDEPDGFGSISEEKVLAGDFSIPIDQRIRDSLQEKLLLIAMAENLIQHEIALREKVNDGLYLVFPSQSTRDSPDLQNPEGKAVTYRFKGPILNIYATLAVRLAHTEAFKKRDLWKNAITYTAKAGGICGISLINIEEGYGELILFFDREASEETRFIFEEYIKGHLNRRGEPGSIQSYRIFECPECRIPFTYLQITTRRSRGFVYILCSVCDTKVSLIEKDEFSAKHSNILAEMDKSANARRDSDAGASISSVKKIRGSTISRQFDVFLCYNKEDLSEVIDIGVQLRQHGIIPWLDEWELQPGLPWQPLLEKQIQKIKSAAVFIGKGGTGPWQQQELYAFLSEFVNRGCPVIPVLLSDVSRRTPKLPIFLKGMTWVDFRQQDPNPLERLIWGITGRRGVITET